MCSASVELQVRAFSSAATVPAASGKVCKWLLSQLSLGAALCSIAYAQTLTFTEYPIPATPSQIAAGPDGALWFTEIETPEIGRITTTGSVTEFSIPTSLNPYGVSPDYGLSIVTGPDGALWFSLYAEVGRLTPSGQFSGFPVPLYQSPYQIVTGPDGALWFTGVSQSVIGRLTTTGSLTLFDLPFPCNSTQFGGITPGPDGAIWFTDKCTNSVGRITTAGFITEYPDGFASSPAGVGTITAGPDGALWFTQANQSIGRITTSGSITAFPVGADLPSGAIAATSITAGPDGALWFDTNTNLLGRITTDGAVTTFVTPTYNDLVTLGPDGALWAAESNGSCGTCLLRAQISASCTYALSSSSVQSAVGGGPTSITITTGASCPWAISGLPTWITLSGSATGSGPASITLVVAPNSGAPRSAQISVAGVMVSVIQASNVLLVNTGGVVNAASYTSPVVPGSIAAIFGNFLLPAPVEVSTFPIPTNLGGLSFQFGNGTLTPEFYANVGQVNVQVPWELADQLQTTITAAINGQTSASQTVSLATYAPGIFAVNSEGTGQGAILDAGNRLVDSTNPAIPGTTVLQIFCTGLGPVSDQPATGQPASLSQLAYTSKTPMVMIGNVNALVSFSGLAPGYVGLYQVNAQVPAGLAANNAVPVMISMDGATSNTVMIAVQ